MKSKNTNKNLKNNENKKKLVFITGRSSSGKNTLANVLLEMKDKNNEFYFKEAMMHTTRPRRTDKESTYIFEDEKTFLKNKKNGYFLETRMYNTNQGVWHYGTALKDILALYKENKIPVIVSGTPKMYRSIKDRLEKENVEICVLYLDIDDEILLERAFNREKTNENPDYREMARRFLSDANDWSIQNTKCFPKKSSYKDDTIENIINNFLERNKIELK